MTDTFRKDELVIQYARDGNSHTIRIVKIANHDVRRDDEVAEVMFGAFAVRTPKDSLYKLPGGIKRRIANEPA